MEEAREKEEKQGANIMDGKEEGKKTTANKSH